MVAHNWTLEGELCQLSGQPDLSSSLVRLGIANAGGASVAVEEVQGWERGGAETYIYRFRTILDSGEAKDYVLKAVTPSSMTVAIEELLQRWVSRRQLIRAEGIGTPKLYIAHKGILLENFIPYALSEVLCSGSSLTEGLCDQVMQLAGVLTKLGFAPIGPFDDLRTDGTSIYVVDFGQDLGPPDVNTDNENAMLSTAIRWLNDRRRREYPIDGFRAKAFFDYGHIGSRRP